MVKALDSQSKRLVKTTGWLQGQLNLLSFQGQSNEYSPVPNNRGKGGGGEGPTNNLNINKRGVQIKGESEKYFLIQL